MQDRDYLFIRRILFWLFFCCFLILTPVVTFYSLGYKFDINAKKFQKTGAISIQTQPKEVRVILNDKEIALSTPYVVRGLLPGKYNLSLEKEGFYAYKFPIEVKPYSVADIDVSLVPKIRNVEKAELDFNVYKFFVIEHIFGKKIVALTDKGIFLFGEDFGDVKKIAALNIDETALSGIEGMRFGKSKLILWNRNNIWAVNFPGLQAQDKEETAGLIYSTKEAIKDVYFALREKNLIIHDGMMVVTLDIKNYSVYFPVYELKSVNAAIFYDPGDDTLLIKDRDMDGEKYSLYKINLRELMREKRTE